MFTTIKHMADPSISCPASALKFMSNTGPTAFFGEKFKVEKVCYILDKVSKSSYFSYLGI
jgi:hypothetical protein